MAILFGKTWKNSHIDENRYMILFNALCKAIRLPKAAKTRCEEVDESEMRCGRVGWQGRWEVDESRTIPKS
ncbi:hypothetical protein C1H46_001759 [Malus baccata]|uniref:Uncharacterized protein n=1 Tax=Malus baccata TaxID=106549 RepID=A0A540NND2_MALBA|nr:hypothetical protein C1H46_001759 [Malus baccata]